MRIFYSRWAKQGQLPYFQTTRYIPHHMKFGIGDFSCLCPLGLVHCTIILQDKTWKFVLFPVLRVRCNSLIFSAKNKLHCCAFTSSHYWFVLSLVGLGVCGLKLSFTPRFCFLPTFSHILCFLFTTWLDLAHGALNLFCGSREGKFLFQHGHLNVIGTILKSGFSFNASSQLKVISEPTTSREIIRM